MPHPRDPHPPARRGRRRSRRPRRPPTSIVGAAILALAALAAVAATFGGIPFPDGEASFADEVDSYDPAIAAGQPDDPYREASNALGPPDCPDGTNPETRPVCWVSLGAGGSITLELTDNLLAGSGDTDPDLWIFEVGPDVEDTFVEISADGDAWQDVGQIGGSTAGVDIDAFGFGPGDEFRYVRLTDDPDEGEPAGETVGADIDAVGANPEPVAVPGLRVRCLHEPLWPQDGEEVTITAESLDGGLNDRTADTVEVWVDDQSAPQLSESGTREATYTAGPYDEGDTIAYGCRVEDDGEAVFSGWRRTQVGEPAERPVPVVFNAADIEAIDVLFVPDEDSYSGPADSDWLADAHALIRDFYYADEVFVSQQRGLNFWLAQDMGTADTGCAFGKPDGFDSDYSFADSVGIFHTDVFRDCASGRLFSAEAGANAYRVILHETGHSPFGLADEYCCDGGYWQPSPHPNLYETADACEDDASDVGRTASDCRQFEDDDGNQWWTSDPASDDLMVDNQTPRALDVRRIDWLFDECARGLPSC